ncbi:hypothetical protein [Sediminitomix flava]|uniref:Tellurite resistance protein TerB n=1 Tax=Sediminitomix flava TaxID=379075 RepID=A0A315Z7S2_SEDFL|nr:hypothetical protein [Sediminitomix flava]PWJ39975.1 hypothetical protein BC781_10538 [Sediminitomix flava]
MQNLNNETIIIGLYESYKKESSSKIELDNFYTLFTYFPCLLIVACDGVIDDEEWVYVKYLARFMADTHRDEVSEDRYAELIDDFYNELVFLSDNLDEWEGKLIEGLRSYLEAHEYEKDDILDILTLFAEASDGVSDIEEVTIENLKTRLELES